MARSRSRYSLIGGVGGLTLLSLAAARPAAAHFVLQAPACWMSQDPNGLPEKLGPCGDEGGGTPTQKVTAFRTGQTITVTIDETIFHPGHYRIALATSDRGQLPPEPVVSPGDNTPCGSVAIQDPPIFPVLADGVFAHNQPFNGPQSIQLKLPDHVTCTKCTLQIIEFMSQHPLNDPGGCFYHHCADLSIQSAPVVDGGANDAGSRDAGARDAGDAGPRDASARDAGPRDASSGGPHRGCSLSTVPSSHVPVGFVLLALFAWRRRHA